MKDLQTILSMLDRDPKGGKLLPTAQLYEEFRAACPLDREKLHMLACCLEECSEQIYEYYRLLIDLFRREIAHADPDGQTIRTGIQLGILDDEEWPLEAKEG